MLATTVDFLKESGQVLLIITGPPTDAIHGVNRLTRTSCSRCPCGSTTFQENLTVSAASTPGSAVLFCWKPPTSAWAQVTGRSSSVPLNQGMGRYTQDLMITPRAMKTIGALLTIIDDHAPRNESYRGFID